LAKLGMAGLGQATNMAARQHVNEDVDYHDVEEALRFLWQDDDVRARGGNLRGNPSSQFAKSIFFGADADTWVEDEEQAGGQGYGRDDEKEDSEVSGEEIEAYAAAKAQEVEGLRTLAAARKQVAQHKISRNSYGPGQGPQTSIGAKRGKSGPCWRREGPYWAKECPDKSDKQLTDGTRKTAAIIFSARGGEETEENASFIDQEVIETGKAVIDCGATGGVGGFEAIEALSRRNLQRHGSTKVIVDRKDRPFFTFGNGKQARMEGRATV